MALDPDTRADRATRRYLNRLLASPPVGAGATTLHVWTVEDGRTFEVERDDGGVSLVVSGDSERLVTEGFQTEGRRPMPTRRIDLSDNADKLAPILLDEIRAALLSEPPTRDTIRRLALLAVARDLVGQVVDGITEIEEPF